MHTARLEIVRVSPSVATARGCSWEAPKINKFDKVSSDHRQMPLARGSQIVGAKGRYPILHLPGETCFTFPRIPYYVTYPMMHLMSYPREQKEACENIAFCITSAL